MAIKKEIYKLEDGKEITIKELSFAGQMRLDKKINEKKHLDMEDLYVECIEPWSAMEEVGRGETKKIIEIYQKLNPSTKDSPSDKGVDE